LYYLKFNIARDDHYTKLKYTFFINYHFKTFFGSTFLGGLYLILITLCFSKNFKNILFKNHKEDIIFYIIFSAYFLTLAYSIIRAPIMSPKYVIFIVPLIIIWILLNFSKIYKINLSKYLVLITIFLYFINIDNYPIKRPPTKKVLEHAIKNDIKLIITTEPDFFINYLKTKKIVRDNKIKIIKYKDDILIQEDKFWFLCLNYARFAHGNTFKNSNGNLMEKKCSDFKLNQYYFNLFDFTYIEILPPNLEFEDYLIKEFSKFSF